MTKTPPRTIRKGSKGPKHPRKLEPKQNRRNNKMINIEEKVEWSTQ